jgi:bifunctional DNA-binding transcriptional regulator/antitoxin component of YhaV-PrlF toxin-antitoxin module
VQKTKYSNEDAISIPAEIAKKFRLKEGVIVEAKVKKGKLVIMHKQERPVNIMKYAGIWENEPVDDVFNEIRKEWNTWQKNLFA